MKRTARSFSPLSVCCSLQDDPEVCHMAVAEIGKVNQISTAGTQILENEMVRNEAHRSIVAIDVFRLDAQELELLEEDADR